MHSNDFRFIDQVLMRSDFHARSAAKINRNTIRITADKKYTLPPMARKIACTMPARTRAAAEIELPHMSAI